MPSVSQRCQRFSSIRSLSPHRLSASVDTSAPFLQTSLNRAHPFFFNYYQILAFSYSMNNGGDLNLARQLHAEFTRRGGPSKRPRRARSSRQDEYISIQQRRPRNRNPHRDWARHQPPSPWQGRTIANNSAGEMNSQALGAGGFLATPSSTVLQPRNPQPALNSTHHLSNSVDTSEARTFEVQQIRDEMRRMRDEMQQMRDKPVAEVLNHAITSTSIIPTERNIGSYTEVEAVNNHCPAYEPTIPGLIAICDPNPYMKRREEPCASEMDVDREDVSTTIPLKTTSSVTRPGLAASIWNPENPRGKADSVSSSQSTQIRQDINKVAPIATSGLLTGPGLGASRWSGF